MLMSENYMRGPEMTSLEYLVEPDTAWILLYHQVYNNSAPNVSKPGFHANLPIEVLHVVSSTVVAVLVHLYLSLSSVGQRYF